MTLLAIAATFGDMATLGWDIEANPLVLALGMWAFPLRLLAVSCAWSAAVLSERAWVERAAVFVALATGLTGAVSNVWARWA